MAPLAVSPSVAIFIASFAHHTFTRVSRFHSGFVVYAAFTKLSRKGQTKFALLLPVIKLIEKNLISRVAINVDDVKPELVIFNVKGFNASSVSFCMQSAGSLQNSVPLVAADFLQAALSMC